MRIHRQSCCLVSSPAHDQTTVGERSRSHDAEAVSEKFRATATTSPRKASASDQVGSHKTLRWRRQSRANPSLKPNSLLAGKIQGILFVGASECDYWLGIQHQIQWFASQFPTHRNREFISP